MAFAPTKYFLVKKEILALIRNEVLKAGMAIPSERELIARYGVSRITVRKALEELEQEGFLYKIQGKGTFVRGRKRLQSLVAITSCTEDVINHGMTPSREIVCSEIVKADEKCRERLALADGDQVFHLERIYYADSEPLNFTSTYLPMNVFPGIDVHQFDHQSLYDVIENEYGVKIARAHRTIEAVLAYDEVSEYLQIHEGAPLIKFNCITYGQMDGIELPIEAFVCFYRSDRLEFYIDQVRE